MKRSELNPAASYQVGYAVNGIDVITAPFPNELMGVALQIEIGGEIIKYVAVNGKLRRTERREIAKILIYAVESGGLLADDNLEPDALSRIITRKSYDVYKGGARNEKS